MSSQPEVTPLPAPPRVDAQAPRARPLVRLSRRVDLSALLTLLKMSLERLLRGKRLLALGLLFLLPTALAFLARYHDGAAFNPAEAEEVFLFYMIPSALVPLTTLIFASGMIADEVEEQTLTYLLIRPVPRWLIYLTKLAATILAAAALTAVFTLAAVVAIHWGAPGFRDEILRDRAPRIVGLMALSTVAYGSLFGLLSLIVRRSLSLGVAYIVLFEGVFANIDFVVRRATVMYHVRVLAERWLGLHVESWSINLEEAPGGLEALLTLLIASAVAALAAAILFTLREFRVKTPEGT